MKSILILLVLMSCNDGQATKDSKIMKEKNALLEKFGEMNCVYSKSNTYVCENKLLYCIKMDSHRKGGVWCIKKDNLDG